MSIMSSSKMKKKKKVAGCSGSSGISAEEDLAVEDIRSYFGEIFKSM